jgi:hypothetical protein
LGGKALNDKAFCPPDEYEQLGRAMRTDKEAPALAVGINLLLNQIGDATMMGMSHAGRRQSAASCT